MWNSQSMAAKGALVGLAALWLGIGVTGGAEVKRQEKPEEPKVKLGGDPFEVLGVTRGEPLDTGFVFLDGRYIDAPYMVSRKGLRVRINETVVYEWGLWPIPDPTVEEDPGMPQGITEKTTCEELRRRHPRVSGLSQNITSRKWRYLYQHFDEETARQKLVDWFRKLPFVEQVRWESRSVLAIKEKTKEEETYVSARLPVRGTLIHQDFGKKDVLERLESSRRQYESAIQEGALLILYGTKGRYLKFGRLKAARDLPLMTRILRSDRPEREKIRLLERMEILPSSRVVDRAEIFHPIVTGFEASGQLEKRIAELQEKTGVTERTLADLPEETPDESEFRRLREKGEIND